MLATSERPMQQKLMALLVSSKFRAVHATRAVYVLQRIVVFALFACAAGSAAAQTASASMPVSATVVKACTASAAALAFGNYLFTANTDATSTLTVTCSNTTAYTINVTNATALTISGPGGATLTYGLYSDAGRSAAFTSVAGVGNGSAQTLTIYGRIPAGQSSATPGAYSGTATINVVY